MSIEDAIQVTIIEPLKAALIANDMVATGALLNSVQLRKDDTVLQQTVYNIVALDYIVGLDLGVEPGETPYPTIPDIQRWIDAKGLDLNPYAVRNSIIANGTTWYRQGGSHIVTDSINAEAFQQVITLAGPEIKNNIVQQWQLLFKNNR